MNISELWQENADFVLKVVQRYVNMQSVAEDIRQEVFLRIITSGDSFRELSSVRTWLYTITFRCCMDYYRDEKRNQEIIDEYKLTAPLVFHDSNSPIWQVNNISEMLCPISQLFVELYFGEGWSREEISQVFGYHADYVSKKIQIGVQQLQKVI
ncbi:MAG: sigma-70 family RNA polymerase sigma factor [Fibromonadales bacterium]|nr:sigma-70 family RNA polymerase sigma factor [Fibromonadales bacterium]